MRPQTLAEFLDTAISLLQRGITRRMDSEVREGLVTIYCVGNIIRMDLTPRMNQEEKEAKDD